MENSNLNLTISSISINESYGSATIILNGDIPVPHEVSDPLAEIFRPLKVPRKDDILFAILIIHRRDSVKLEIYPSNRRKRNGWCEIATQVLHGTTDTIGLLDEYKEMLEKYFDDTDGLNLYLHNVAEIEKAESTILHTVFCHKCDEDTKKFVKKQGHKMPSLKKPAD